MSETFSHLQSRILTHYPNIKALANGELPPPRFMILYPTYDCPAKCSYCEYREDIDKYPGKWEMDHDQVVEVIGDAHWMGVESVEMCGGGEPTTHPEFLSLASHVIATGMKLGLLTNGWGLGHVGGMSEFLAKNASYVRISLDAATGDTYQKVKGLSPETFTSLLEHIRKLVALRGYESRCKISGKFLITEDNYTEIPEMAKLTRRLGLDSAQFKLVRHTKEVSDTIWRAATGLLEYTKKRQGRYPVVGNFYKLTMREKCWLCPLHVLVDADGSVYMCCYFRHRKSHWIGNVKDTPLAAIWGGPQHREALEAINPDECNLFDCRFVKYHDQVNELVVRGEGQFEFL